MDVIKLFLLLYAKIFCISNRVYLYFMHLLFGFNRWHIVGNVHCRPYKIYLANILNKLNSELIVEVGCGLGEILLHLKAKRRKGYDIDKGAIKYLNFINRSQAEFYIGSFSEVKESNIDILILVNWIHELHPDDLKKQILTFKSKCRYILLDKIDLSAPITYKYKHNFDYIKDLSLEYKVYRYSNEPREFILFRFI
jgi:SAM-dependent methyltransferase